MAPDSNMMKPSSSSVGMRPLGLSFRYQSAFCSWVAKSITRLVGQAHLLERNGDLPAVRRRCRIEFDGHRFLRLQPQRLISGPTLQLAAGSPVRESASACATAGDVLTRPSHAVVRGFAAKAAGTSLTMPASQA